MHTMALGGVKTALKDLHHLKGTGLVVAARAQGPSEKTKVGWLPHVYQISASQQDARAAALTMAHT